MTNDVFRTEERKRYAIHVLQDFDYVLEAGHLLFRQIGLSDVTRHHRLGAEANARQKHFHLLDRRVLAFVENDEGIIQ